MLHIPCRIIVQCLTLSLFRLEAWRPSTLRQRGVSRSWLRDADSHRIIWVAVSHDRQSLIINQCPLDYCATHCPFLLSMYRVLRIHILALISARQVNPSKIANASRSWGPARADLKLLIKGCLQCGLHSVSLCLHGCAYECLKPKNLPMHRTYQSLRFPLQSIHATSVFRTNIDADFYNWNRFFESSSSR